MIRRPRPNLLRMWRGRLVLWLLGVAWTTSRRLRLRGVFSRRVARMIRASGLFDTEYYLEMNPDVRSDLIAPELHYLRFGDRDGRFPMPLFDPGYYRTHAGLQAVFPPALLHYSLLGRYLKHPASAWFDTEYYLKQNRDVSRSGKDPLLHFLRHGGVEGRSPSRLFDSAFYLRSNPDLVLAGINPLVHFLRVGRLEGREPRGDALAAEGNGVDAEASLREAIAGSAPRADCEGARVDVVVPVYGQRLATLRCLRSVLASQCVTPFNLVVIDDAGPDEELRELLQTYATSGQIRLLANERNRGFVHSANRGMLLSSKRDVVLLNSDTEVWGDWLDRLRTTAYRDPRTGTVTPLSNNATIASYPRFLNDNPYPLEITGEQLDALTARLNAGVAVEAPTGVGFCLYLRRDCLDEVGLFDEEAFGLGYGEENDFCQRAIAHDWKNLIAADVFVWHFGGLSFKGEKSARIARGMAALRRMHLQYESDVQDFIEADPLAESRRRLDMARLGAAAQERNVLIVFHNRGGGSERHVQEDTRRLIGEGCGVFHMRPVHGRPGMVRIAHPRQLHLPNLPSISLADTDGLVRLLRQLRISSVHSHGLVDFTADAAARLVDLVRALGVPLDCEIHDYQVICPRLNLADGDGMYCGEPDESGCNDCLRRLGNKFGAIDIAQWRNMQGAMLRSAAAVWVPDADARDRLARYFPDVGVRIDPHESQDVAGVRIRCPGVVRSDPLRIIVIGAIGLVKGFNVLQQCARDAVRRALPIEFVLLGYSMDDDRLRGAGVRVTGRYLEHDGAQRLLSLAPHAVWLPSLWPETYSYTLSLALSCGFPAFCFDVGAMPNRLRAQELSEFILPLELAREPVRLNERFLAYRESIVEAHEEGGILDLAAMRADP